MAQFKNTLTSLRYHTVTAPLIRKVQKWKGKLLTRAMDKYGGTVRQVHIKTRAHFRDNPRTYDRKTQAGLKRRKELAAKLKSTGQHHMRGSKTPATPVKPVATLSKTKVGGKVLLHGRALHTKYNNFKRIGRTTSAIKASKTHGELKRRLRVQATKSATANLAKNADPQDRARYMRASRKTKAKIIKGFRKTHGSAFMKRGIRKEHENKMQIAAKRLASRSV